MPRIVFITPESPPHGFAIAGFDQCTVSSERAEERIELTAADEGVGVIIVDERLLENVDEQLLQQLQRKWQGILLVLPTPAGKLPVEDDYLQRLIQRALGYHVRIRE